MKASSFVSKCILAISFWTVLAADIEGESFRGNNERLENNEETIETQPQLHLSNVSSSNLFDEKISTHKKRGGKIIELNKVFDRISITLPSNFRNNTNYNIVKTKD